MTRLLARLGRDTRGVSAVEFGVVGPLLIVMVAGMMELSFDIWAKAMLTGAVQEAGRNSGVESYHKNQAALDDRVAEQVNAFLPSAKLAFSRKNYQSFTGIGVPEDFSDTNKNGKYDANECFEDKNGNGVWDADGGAQGQGGARDVVVYTATMTYHELLPVSSLLGFDANREFSATTTLMNQPFSTQADRIAKEVCP